MYCKRCGTKIIEGKKFCTKCGAEVLNFKTETNSAGGMSKKTLTLICIIAGVVVAGIITTVIILNNRNSIADDYMDYAESAVGQYKDAINGIASAAGDISQAFSESSAAEAAQNSSLMNPFEKISVSFTGTEGSGKTIIESTGEISPIYFTVNGRDGQLKNGDIVTISFEYNEFKKYYPNCEVNTFTNQYTVFGLEALVQSSSPANQTPTQSSFTESSSSTVPNWLWTDVSSQYFILPDADSVYYPASVFAGFTDDQLRYARNEICAHAGREYTSGEYASYFRGFYWYAPYYGGKYFDDNCDSIINKYEKHNLDLINAEEVMRKKN